MCCCAIGCRHSTLNRLFSCVFLVWRHHLRKVNKSSVHTCKLFFSTIFLFLTFLSIHIYFVILKTYDQQFTLTTKKSLHIIFKTCNFSWSGARRELLVWCKGRLTEADTVTIRPGATPSGLTISPSPIFFTGRMPFLLPNQQCQSTEGN